MIHHCLWFSLFIIWLWIVARQGKCRLNSSEKQMKRMRTYRLFFLLNLSTMMTSFTFVLRSQINFHRGEQIGAILILVIAGWFLFCFH